MKRLLRALLGALWSVPLRFVSIPAIAGVMLVQAGGALTAASLLQPAVVLSGIAVSVLLRFVDNVAVEFALFPALMKLITRKGPPQ